MFISAYTSRVSRYATYFWSSEAVRGILEVRGHWTDFAISSQVGNSSSSHFGYSWQFPDVLVSISGVWSIYCNIILHIWFCWSVQPKNVSELPIYSMSIMARNDACQASGIVDFDCCSFLDQINLLRLRHRSSVSRYFFIFILILFYNI